MVKKLAVASGAENWNCLQNNGRVAHQEVDHVSLYPIFFIMGIMVEGGMEGLWRRFWSGKNEFEEEGG